MNTENQSLFKQPTAWIPLAMSFVALAMILGYVAMFGIVHNKDEGAPAHIFQLIMVAQLPIAAFFGLSWITKKPKETLVVLVMQAIAWIIPILTVMWFESL
ncbi:MAG: hypothetical protein IH588_13680 [Anaerolineales bacterium]|nr:hypothetical protein [Anaerolineales bacterium]